MNVSVVDVSSNQKKLQVEIPAQKVQEEFEARYRDLAKRVRIKGFRPGKVPRSILKSYYGKSIEQEVSSQFIQETFPEALREADLRPLVEADVSETHFDDNGAFMYVAVVDVCPPFEVEGYKGMDINKPPIVITDEQVQAELERVREQHAQLSTLETERPIEEGDTAVVDFTPMVDGAVFEKGKTSDYMLEVGKNTLHPDFDGHLVGRKAGESLAFELDYPEDASTPEIQGKRVHFDVTIKEIKVKDLPELDDELAQTAGKFETLDDLKGAIREQLQKREENRISTEARQQIADKLQDKIELDLSSKVIEREVDRLIGLLRHQFESQGLKIDTSKFNTPEIRGEYRAQAVRNIKQRLIMHQIAKQENIELTEEDMDQIYRQIALYARMDVDKVKSEYADSSIVEQSKEDRIQEKVFKLIEETAVYTEASEEAESSDKE